MPLPVRLLVPVLLLCSAAVMADELPGEKVEATTAAGEKVILHPNGRWEYVDAVKAKAANEIAQQYPENKACPPGWRGGLMGIGRCVPPTDKDFNRGSMSGK